MAADRPAWAQRLFDERVERRWSQKEMAIRLRAAASERERRELPTTESLRRYVRAYESGDHFPRDYAQLYCRAFGLARVDLFGAGEGAIAQAALGETDAATIAEWIESSNTSDDVLGYLDVQTAAAAADHAIKPPSHVLADVRGLHAQVQFLLRGKQRLWQRRELMRIDGMLLAHMCLLLGDVHRDDASESYGVTSALMATEAGASPAAAFSAWAIVARWQNRDAHAADLAAAGYSRCPAATPLRGLLACQEANGAALAGDERRAHSALSRAAVCISNDSESAWSLPASRYAAYQVSVALSCGDAIGALRDAESAERPRSNATWAHLRLSAASAQLMLGSLDNAVSEASPILSMPGAYRVATVTRHLQTVDGLLHLKRFRASPAALTLSSEIKEFTDTAPGAMSCAGAG